MGSNPLSLDPSIHLSHQLRLPFHKPRINRKPLAAAPLFVSSSSSSSPSASSQQHTTTTTTISVMNPPHHQHDEDCDCESRGRRLGRPRQPWSLMFGAQERRRVPSPAREEMEMGDQADGAVGSGGGEEDEGRQGGRGGKRMGMLGLPSLLQCCVYPRSGRKKRQRGGQVQSHEGGGSVPSLEEEPGSSEGSSVAGEPIVPVRNARDAPGAAAADAAEGKKDDVGEGGQGGAAGEGSGNRVDFQHSTGGHAGERSRRAPGVAGFRAWVPAAASKTSAGLNLKGLTDPRVLKPTSSTRSRKSSIQEGGQVKGIMTTTTVERTSADQQVGSDPMSSHDEKKWKGSVDTNATADTTSQSVKAIFERTQRVESWDEDDSAKILKDGKSRVRDKHGSGSGSGVVLSGGRRKAKELFEEKKGRVRARKGLFSLPLSLSSFERSRSESPSMLRTKEEEVQEPSSERDYGSGSFDEDAVAMKTPRSTWGRAADQALVRSHSSDGRPQISRFDALSLREDGLHGGLAPGQDQPRRLSRVLQKSMSSIPPSHADMDRRDFQTSSIDPRTTLTRMLTSRAESQSDGPSSEKRKQSEDSASSEKSNEIQVSKKKNRYIFDDSSEDKAHDQPKPFAESKQVKEAISVPRTAEPEKTFDRSETVIRLPELAASTQDEPDPESYLAVLKPPRAPEILPQRMSSLTGSMLAPQWRLSFSGAPPLSGLSSVSSAFNTRKLSSGGRSDQLPQDDDHPDFPRDRAVGAAHLVDKEGTKPRAKVKFADVDYKQGTDFDPEKEEKTFGGVDGIAAERNINDGQQPEAPQTVHVQQQAVHGELAPASSMSQLHSAAGGAVDDLDRYTRGDSCPNSKVARKWSLPLFARGLFGESSLSTEHETQANERDALFSEDRPPENNREERRTDDTSYHSSTESLINRELAAIEQRILPRSKTLKAPKTSWFKEDFDEVAEELERTKPAKRRFTGLDGGNDLRGNLSVRSNSSRYSIVSRKSDEPTISAWEKALRDHANEDSRLSKTRIGSDSPFEGTSRFSSIRANKGSHKQESDIVKDDSGPQLDVSQPEVTVDLQARLQEYRLGAKHLRPLTTPSRQIEGPSRSSSGESAWAKYPSHNLAQRSPASAGKADNVFARDFALENTHLDETVDPLTGGKSKARPLQLLLSERKGMAKSRSMTFGRRVADKMKDIYYAGDLEFQRRYGPDSHGHRSSISEGRLVEYPELEMLAPLSEPHSVQLSPSSFDLLRKPSHKSAIDLRSLRSRSEDSFDVGDMNPSNQEPRVGRSSARAWSKMYQDCIQDPKQDSLHPHVSSSSRYQRDRYLSTSDIGPMDRRETGDLGNGEEQRPTFQLTVTVEDGETRGEETLLRPSEESAPNN